MAQVDGIEAECGGMIKAGSSKKIRIDEQIDEINGALGGVPVLEGSNAIGDDLFESDGYLKSRQSEIVAKGGSCIVVESSIK